MVELIAIIRRARAAATKEELARTGCPGYSQWTVLGRGRQRGLHDGEGGAALPFLPKTLIHVVAENAQAAEIVEAVIRANQTGQFGDGRIFVVELTGAYRISTGAREPDLHDAEELS